jgi:hypothetical protein
VHWSLGRTALVPRAHEKVDLKPDMLDITLKIEGLTSLCAEVHSSSPLQQAAE